jgi:hypothetical protein
MRVALSNNALQLTSGGPLARASRAPLLSRRLQLNAVLCGPSLRVRDGL